MSPSWPAYARHRGYVAMGFATDVVFETDVVAQIVDETRLPIPAVILRIVDGYNVLKLRRADPTNALDRAHLVGMRRAGSVDEGLFVEAARFDHQRVTLEMTDRVTVVERECGQLLFAWHRLVHGDDADLMIEFMDDGDLPGRRLNDLEGIGCSEQARQPIRHTVFSGGIRDGAVFKASHVLLIGGFTRLRERQFATADKLDLGTVFCCPIGSGNIRRFGIRRTGQDQYSKNRRPHKAGASKNPKDSHLPLPICLSTETRRHIEARWPLRSCH